MKYPNYKNKIFNYSCAVIASMASSTMVLAEEEQSAVDLQNYEVIGIGPIQGTGVLKSMVPANVLTINADDFQHYQSLTLGDQMNRQLGSVNINDAQNNPFQPNVQYRGFTASPLLGLPQGLSIYVDGVRFNEPFGDTVNWDLIPENAIDQMTLHPGSDPVYGLNALGGSISLRTKTGFTAPGHEFEAETGSWGRHSEEISSGWNDGTFGYFFDIKNFEENGWRDKSPTDVRQGLASFSFKTDRGGLDLTIAANDNEMFGNGSLPIQFQKIDDKEIFTHPDITRTRLFFTTLNSELWVTDDYLFTANGYFRQNKVRSFNGDDSDYEECEDAGNAGLLCEEDDDDEAVVYDVDGNPVDAGDDVEGATNNFSQTHQRSYGGTIQNTLLYDLFGFENHFVIGSSYDYSEIHFESDTELGSMTESRGTTRSGILVDEARVRLLSRVKHFGVYFSDTFSVTDDLAVTLSGRYNRSQMELRDQYGDDLNGNHTFDRFNPSAGMTYTFSPQVSGYLRYGESNRAPTAMELTCANPDDPCKLPNAFVSDPPLDQVIARTWEAGFRGRFSNLLGTRGYVDWHAGVFHTENRRDIIFISSGGLTNEGYFDNVGSTRRRGVELNLSGEFQNVFSYADDWSFSFNYSYVNAEFRDPFIAASPNNPAADEDSHIYVNKGDRIPTIPEHILKFTTDVTLWDRWQIGIDGMYNGNQVYRGDESNDLSKLGGYWVFHARSEITVNEYLTFFGKVNNIFDREYKSFGVLGEADEVLGDDFDDNRFVGQGEPRSAWIGVRLSL